MILPNKATVVKKARIVPGSGTIVGSGLESSERRTLSISKAEEIVIQKQKHLLKITIVVK